MRIFAVLIIAALLAGCMAQSTTNVTGNIPNKTVTNVTGTEPPPAPPPVSQPNVTPPANQTAPPPQNQTPPPPPPSPPANQTPPPSPPQPSVKEYTIEADDNGFYPGSPIEVSKGDSVKITFMVRTNNVYYGGLQFKSTAFSTGKVSPGGSKTVEFTAEGDMTITSYWGASLVKKADLQVKVS